MLPKKFINKCLFLLNNTCRYTNVTYSLDIYDNCVSIFVHIWKSNKIIIKTYSYNIMDEDDFTKFSTDILTFINKNKELIK